MIFSHVLYQLSYPGIAAAATRWVGERLECAPMANRRGDGKGESVLASQFSFARSSGVRSPGAAGGPGTA